MDWGKKNRLSQLMPGGRAYFLPIDHGYFLGPTRKLEKPGETIAPLLPYCDALFVTRGVLRACVNPVGSLPVILRISGGTSIVGADLAHEKVTTSMEDIIRLNAAAVGISVFIGSDYEHETLLNLSETVNMCQDYGIPVMAVTAVGKELEKRDARYLALCCRICAELGAHIVKTYYVPEDFATVTASCPVPIVMAGGKKMAELDALTMAYNAVQEGASGVDMGRNIFQSDAPKSMIQAVGKIVHEDLKPKEAYELYQTLKKDELKKE